MVINLTLKIKTFRTMRYNDVLVTKLDKLFAKTSPYTQH